MLDACAGVLTAIALAGPSRQVQARWATNDPECPTAQQFDLLVAGRLAEAPDRDAPAANAEIAVQPDGDRWLADVVVATRDGVTHRRLDASDCGALAEATALVIAIAVDPIEVVEQTPSVALWTPRPVPTPPPASRRPPDRPDRAPQSQTGAVSEQEPPRPDSRGTARVDAGVGVGPLPAATPIVRAAAGYRRRYLRVDVTGSYWFGRRARLSADPDVSATLLLWTAGVRVCGVPELGKFELPICSGLDAGLMHGRGEGSPITRTGSRPLVAVPLDFVLARPLTRHIGVWLGLSGALVALQPVFVIDGRGEIHRAAPVSFSAAFGVEARFP